MISIIQIAILINLVIGSIEMSNPAITSIVNSQVPDDLNFGTLPSWRKNINAEQAKFEHPMLEYIGTKHRQSRLRNSNNVVKRTSENKNIASQITDYIETKGSNEIPEYLESKITPVIRARVINDGFISMIKKIKKMHQDDNWTIDEMASLDKSIKNIIEFINDPAHTNELEILSENIAGKYSYSTVEKSVLTDAQTLLLKETLDSIKEVYFSLSKIKISIENREKTEISKIEAEGLREYIKDILRRYYIYKDDIVALENSLKSYINLQENMITNVSSGNSIISKFYIRSVIYMDYIATVLERKYYNIFYESSIKDIQ